MAAPRQAEQAPHPCGALCTICIGASRSIPPRSFEDNTPAELRGHYPRGASTSLPPRSFDEHAPAGPLAQTPAGAHSPNPAGLLATPPRGPRGSTTVASPSHSGTLQANTYSYIPVVRTKSTDCIVGHSIMLMRSDYDHQNNEKIIIVPDGITISSVPHI